VIDVGAVSRYHCKVFVANSNSDVEDLKSRNGTFINETISVGRTRLAAGDQIRVCDVVFTYRVEDDSSPRSIEGSSVSAVIIDDEEESSSSTIMSKLNVVSTRGKAQLAASAELKLDALIEITKSLAKALELDEVLPQVLDSLFRIFHQADRGFVGLLDKDGTLIPRWTKLRRENSNDTIRVSRTIASRVVETKEAIISADAANDERFEMSQSIADFRIRSMMCAPLLDGENKAIGILQIDTLDQRQRFQNEDLELLVSIAFQAAISIDNTQLHEERFQQRFLERIIERDLQLAKDVQNAFLPRAHPKIDGYDFFDYYQAANQIGGDYYDYIRLVDGRIVVVVADVVGHGIAAAMLMAKLSAETRFCLASESDPAAAVTQLNKRMCQFDLNRFVTLAMVTFDPKTHVATIVNAGHPPPIHRHVDGSLDEPSRDEARLPIGVMDGVDYVAATVTLEPGESLTLFTDGLDEAMDPEGQQFGIERIREIVAAANGDPQETGDSLLTQIRHHMGSHPQDDDMCLVVFRRKE
jgi:serine phosphatase RsbU (regulator of sigma subunit)